MAVIMKRSTLKEICYFIVGRKSVYYENVKATLKRHKSNVQRIDVTYYLCTEEGCDYIAKVAKSVKTHKAAIHDIV